MIIYCCVLLPTVMVTLALLSSLLMVFLSWAAVDSRHSSSPTLITRSPVLSSPTSLSSCTRNTPKSHTGSPSSSSSSSILWKSTNFNASKSATGTSMTWMSRLSITSSNSSSFFDRSSSGLLSYSLHYQNLLEHLWYGWFRNTSKKLTECYYLVAVCFVALNVLCKRYVPPQSTRRSAHVDIVDILSAVSYNPGPAKART